MAVLRCCYNNVKKSPPLLSHCLLSSLVPWFFPCSFTSAGGCVNCSPPELRSCFPALMCSLYSCLLWSSSLSLTWLWLFPSDTFWQWWGTFLLKIVQQRGLLDKLTWLLLHPELLVAGHETKGLGVGWACQYRQGVVFVSQLLFRKQIDETGQLSSLNLRAFSVPGSSGCD